MKKITRNTTTPENAQFWQSAVKSAQSVESWPAWKKGWVAQNQSKVAEASTTPSSPKVEQEG